jgi:PAS domain S-box-containing protein
MAELGEQVDHTEQLSEDGSQRREVTRQLKDGTKQAIDISSFPILDEDGIISNWAGIGRDISDRRRADEAMAQHIRYEGGLAGCSRALLEESDKDTALRKALQHLLTASESSMVYLARNLEDDKMGTCMCITHYAVDEKYRELVEREMPMQRPYDAGLRRWRNLMAAGKPVVGDVNSLPEAEKQILLDNGLKSVIALPITVEGQWYGFVGFDDYERERGAMEQEIQLLCTAAEMIGGFLEAKRFERALRVSEQRFRTLVEQANDIIFSLDPDGKFTYMSPQFSKATGMPQDACIGLYLWDHLSTADVAQARAWVAAGMPDDFERNPLGYQFHLQARNGSQRWFTANVAVLRDEAGTVIEGVGVAHDITEMKRLLEDLGNANTELRETQTQLAQSEKMASLGMLVAGIAHEINTPVGAINSMHDTEMRAVKKLRHEVENKLGQGHPAQAGLLKYLQTIEEAGQVIASGTERVTNIVRRLRSFARLDESELKMADIHEGLEDTLTLIHAELKLNITVQRDYGDLPKIACYPGQLNQVFLNLLINAKQAIEGKGEIRITTRIQNGNVIVVFSDTGQGIPHDQLAHIFDPGFTTKGVGVGTGLGLSICYQIISQHRGDIKAESEVGKGSQFTITLPTDLASRNSTNRSGDSPDPG